LSEGVLSVVEDAGRSSVLGFLSAEEEGEEGGEWVGFDWSAVDILGDDSGEVKVSVVGGKLRVRLW
jgi:hypothetical protein